MYSTKPHVVYGFHAINEADGLDILNNRASFISSNNKYDWLGRGVYFWENSYERAKQYALEDMQRQHTKIQVPFVLGAVIELGNCLDLLDQKNIDLLSSAHEYVISSLQAAGRTIPTNRRTGSKDFDFKMRELDCAVINQLHERVESWGATPFDSVRSAFLEGDEMYPGAGFKRNNHIQISVINRNCIKGIFIPRERESGSDAW